MVWTILRYLCHFCFRASSLLLDCNTADTFNVNLTVYIHYRETLLEILVMEKTARWYVRIYFKFISLQWGHILTKKTPGTTTDLSHLFFFFRRILSGTSIGLFWRMYQKGTRDKMWSVLRAYDSGKLKTRKNLISETYYTQMIMTVILTTISDLKKNFYLMNTDKKTWRELFIILTLTLLLLQVIDLPL